MRCFVVLGLFFLLTACQSTTYTAEKGFGIEERDKLVSRMEEIIEAQEGAKENFQSALHYLSRLIDSDGSDLDEIYRDTQENYSATEAAVEAVMQRLEGVENAAQNLFNEWETELDGYQSVLLRANSQRKLYETRSRYGMAIDPTRGSIVKMGDILVRLENNLFYLQHNMNARVQDQVPVEFVSKERDIRELLTDIERSKSSLSRFIDSVRNEAWRDYHGLWVGGPGLEALQYVAQHVMQYSPMLVVNDLVGGVDAHPDR